MNSTDGPLGKRQDQLPARPPLQWSPSHASPCQSRRPRRQCRPSRRHLRPFKARTAPIEGTGSGRGIGMSTCQSWLCRLQPGAQAPCRCCRPQMRRGMSPTGGLLTRARRGRVVAGMASQGSGWPRGAAPSRPSAVRRRIPGRRIAAGHHRPGHAVRGHRVLRVCRGEDSGRGLPGHRPPGRVPQAGRRDVARCDTAARRHARPPKPWTGSWSVPGASPGAAWLARPLPGGVWLGFTAGKAIAYVAWSGLEASARRGVARPLAVRQPA